MFLTVVQAVVGKLNQILYSVGKLGLRHTEGHGDFHGTSLEDYLHILNVGPHTFRNRGSGLQTTVDDDEDFLAAPAAYEVGIAKLGGDGVRHGYKHLVAAVMSVFVVYSLKVVDISKNDGEGVCIFLQMMHGKIQSFHHAPAVRKLG